MHHRRLPCVEDSKQTGFPAFSAQEVFRIRGDVSVEPAAQALYRPVELYHEIQHIVLVGIVAPHSRRELVDRTFNAEIVHFPDIHSLELDAVFCLRMELDEDAPVAPVRREREPLESASCRGCDFRLYAVVSQVGRIIADACLLGPLVYARAVSLVRLLLIAHTCLQLPVGGHDAEPSHGPFMDMAETSYILERGLVSGLPSSVLVVRTHLHHAERHPRPRGDHPSRVCRADTCIHVVGKRLRALRRTGYCA